MKYNNYLLESKSYPLSVLQNKAAELVKQGRSIINLTIGDPKDDTFSKVPSSLVISLNKSSYSQYPKSEGSLAYREAVSTWAKNYYNSDLNPETDIISCNGTKEAIFSFPKLFSWESDNYIFIPSMAYPVYLASAKMHGISVKILPLNFENNFLPDLDLITKDEWRKCSLFWLNSPHNPTSAIASREYIKKLLSLAEQYDFIVCSDECYNDLYYVEEKPTSCIEFPMSERWVVFRSLSKRSHMTGYRIGAIISKNKELIKLLSKMRLPMGVGTPSFIQEAAISAWNDQSHVDKLITQYKEKRDILIKALKSKKFEIFGGNAGFYLWIKHRHFTSSNDLCAYFLEADILLTPGTAFGEDGEGFARMVFCETLEKIKEVAKKIENLRIL